jgi:FkbM family methyltransferase
LQKSGAAGVQDTSPQDEHAEKSGTPHGFGRGSRSEAPILRSPGNGANGPLEKYCPGKPFESDFIRSCFRSGGRNFEIMLLKNALLLPFYLPRILGLFSNWPEYLTNYLLRKRRPTTYTLRNGFRLIDGTGTLAGTIAVVFVRHEYGPLDPDYRTIVDIGANMGCFTVFAAKECPKARILSFEPEQNNFRYLNQNIQTNALESRITSFQCAVAGEGGAREIVIDASPLHTLLTTAGVGKMQKVQCTTIRDIMGENGLETIDFMKINCEGAEYEILGNCSQEDLSRIRRLHLEYHNFDTAQRNGKALAALLKTKGFAVERFTTYINHRGIFSASGFIWAARA